MKQINMKVFDMVGKSKRSYTGEIQGRAQDFADMAKDIANPPEREYRRGKGSKTRLE
jgi:hypothetical protein